MQVPDSLLERHRAFWTRAEVSQPLLTVVSPTPLAPLQIPTPAGVALPPEGYLRPEMLDPLNYFEQLTARWEGLGPIDGDQFRIMTAYWYVPWLEAICGCPIWFVRESGTMYSEPLGGDWDAVRTFRLTRNNPWLAKLREFCLVMGELAAGRYPLGVAMPMRGPLDLLGALVGVERMCLGFAENPHPVREALRIVTDVWIEAVGEQLALLPPFAEGMANCEQYGSGSGAERRHPV